MQTSFDWSRNCKRFYFNVELPQDQDTGTSLIHTSIFEFPINSFGCEVTSWWHYITSRERVKYHAYFPCMCHTYFTTYSLLLWLKEKDCTREESDTSCDRNFKGWVLIGLQLFVTTSELPNFRSCCCCCCCFLWTICQGLLFGTYTDRGDLTCAGRPGALRSRQGVAFRSIDFEAGCCFLRQEMSRIKLFACETFLKKLFRCLISDWSSWSWPTMKMFIISSVRSSACVWTL